MWEYIQEFLFYRFIRWCNCHDLYSIFDILKVKYQKTGIQKLINFFFTNYLFTFILIFKITFGITEYLMYTETLLYKNPMSATRHIKIN